MILLGILKWEKKGKTKQKIEKTESISVALQSLKYK